MADVERNDRWILSAMHVRALGRLIYHTHTHTHTTLLCFSFVYIFVMKMYIYVGYIYVHMAHSRHASLLIVCCYTPKVVVHVCSRSTVLSLYNNITKKKKKKCSMIYNIIFNFPKSNYI